MAISKFLTVNKVDDVTIISFGEDASSIQGSIAEEVSPVLLQESDSSSPHLLIDLAHVDFFNSSFIELLVRAWNRIKTKPEGKFALCNVQPYCKDILEVTNLTTVWKIYASQEEAIQALQAE